MRKIIKSYLNFVNEELNVDGTYFTSKDDELKSVEKEFQTLINEIAKKKNILLPVISYSKEFLIIKNELEKNIDDTLHIKKYLEEYMYDKNLRKKFIENLIVKFCSTPSKNKPKKTTDKLNITNLDFKLVDDVDNVETYQVIFPEDIKNHILNNYSTNKLDVYIYINCESDKFNRLHFPGRIDRWYRGHGKRFGKDEQPQPYKGKHGQWISDLFDGIPESLRGTGLGFAIYKEFIKFKGYVSSNSWSSSLSQSVWKKLSGDPDLHGILVNYNQKEGDVILFSKNFKGDYKKICEDFLEKAKKGLLYRGDSENFQIRNIEIDPEIQKLLVVPLGNSN